MVTIAKKGFNDDLDAYIGRLRGKSASRVDVMKKPKMKPVAEKVPEISEEEVYVEYETKQGLGVRDWLSSLFRRRIPEDFPEDLPAEDAEVLEEMEGEIEGVSHKIERLEEERESLWSQFLRSMRLSRHKSEREMKEELLDEVVPVIDEDVKQTLKILHTWLGKLPRHEMQAFKQSEDFQRYKAVLEKYGLVKK